MNNRKKANRALDTWDEVLALIIDMDKPMREMLIRDRFGTDKQQSPLLGAAKGTPPPGHSDPVGDEGAEVDSKYLPDPTHKDVIRLGLLVHIAKALLDKLATLSDTDVRRRAAMTKAICLACGDDILIPTERVKAGFDAKCYRRYLRAGRPDRVAFIAKIQAERAAKEPTKDGKEDVSA